MPLPSKRILLIVTILGIAITGITGKIGGWLKLYNDIPSLLGYGSLALFIYSLGLKTLNRFFEYTCKFSYEWYLMLACIIALVASYLAAIPFHALVKRLYKLRIWKK